MKKQLLLVLVLRLCFTVWTHSNVRHGDLTFHFNELHANFTHLSRRIRRFSRTVHLQHNEQVRRLLDRDDFVTAVLHYIELTHNRSDSQYCTTASLSHFRYELSNETYDLFDSEVFTAVKTANLLTTLFLKTKDVTELLHNEDFYYTIVKLNVQSEQQVFSSAIAFQRGRFRPENSLFCPFAYRIGAIIETKDLAKTYNHSYDDPNWIGSEWFRQQAMKNYTDILVSKTSDYLYDDWKMDIIVGPEDGMWSAPYYDCGGGNTWVVTYSVPFFSRTERSKIEFGGVVALSFDLRNLDINQCANDDSLFAGTHKCERITTRCVPISGLGFRRGGYECQCRRGFYFPSEGSSNMSQVSGFNGLILESAFVANQLQEEEEFGMYPDDFRCLPCKIGCESCIDASPCFVEYNMILRSLALGFQSFCTTVTIVLAIVVFRLRKSKIVASARWVKLEMILFGALLIYQTVIVRYFEPSNIICLIEPWFRELGFAICYGAIVLKIYRILAEFQTRKAHRVCVRDKDLLKYLFGIVMVVVGYMAAWTAVVMDNARRGHSILEEGQTAEGLRYYLCRSLWWDYVTEIGELLFLLLGIYLTYCVRNARNDYFKEKCALCWSLYIEAIVSFLMYAIRHVIWLRLDPDFIFLMYFLRCQLTITILLAIIFGPKLWYHSHPVPRAEHVRHYSSSEVHDHLPEAIMSSGDVDITEINLSEMDPEDIRAELRRVYTQLQILRNKTMRKDNPHISKRRGGRKVTHRRFSLQPFHHKHKHYHDHDHETTEVSKTPEESTASIEGTMPFPIDARTDDNSGKMTYK